MVKRNPKDGGKRGGGGNGGNGGGNCQRKSRTANKGCKNHHSPSSNGDDKKIVRSGCYFCEGPHKSSDCLNRTNSTAPAATSNGSKAGGMIANVKIVGAGPLVNMRAGAALSAGVTTLDEYWMGDRGATEGMTTDGTVIEDYQRSPPGDRVETADGKLIPVAGFGRLRLLVDQEDGSFSGETQVLTLDRVAHVPEIGTHNLISAKRLARAFDAPMRIYPAAATIRPRRGGKPLVFRTLPSDSDFLRSRRAAAPPPRGNGGNPHPRGRWRR